MVPIPLFDQPSKNLESESFKGWVCVDFHR